MSTLRVVLVLAGLVAALLLGLWLRKTDKDRVREAADAIVAGANQGTIELGRALDEHAAEGVTVTVSDLPEPLVGRAAIVAAAGRSAAGGQKLSFHMEGVQITVEGTNARLNASFVATLQLGLRGLSRSRSGVAVFQKIDGRFQLVSAEVGGER
jgi:FlaG/FlaF family flagellin (archaellin)